MNTKEFEERQNRIYIFKMTVIGKAFHEYKEASLRSRQTAGDHHYQALEDAYNAEDRLMAACAHCG